MSFPFFHLYREKPTEVNYSVDILAWHGEGCPAFCVDLFGQTYFLLMTLIIYCSQRIGQIGTPLDGMKTLCTITADLACLFSLLQEQSGPNGEKYWMITFQVCVIFGGTQLKAFLQWKEGVCPVICFASSIMLIKN